MKTFKKFFEVSTDNHDEVVAIVEDVIYEDVFSDLENIVKKKSMKKVKFANGKTLEVDLFTASAFVNMFKKVNPKNAERGKAHIEKSPENFMKMMDLAMGGSKK